ncbi:MAG: molybdopterin cofactor-binding domain-containing protein [Bacteroidota bacterium]
MKPLKISRRKFVQLSAVSGSFLAIGCIPTSDGKEVVRNLSNNSDYTLNQFIKIGTDGLVTLFTHRPEMGQGTFQSMPMILAEELEVDIDKVKIEQSPANRELFGSQMVVGSRSVQSEYHTLRKMGAAAREILIVAAAKQWNISKKECFAENTMVKQYNSDKKIGYGALVKAASKLTAPENPTLKNPQDFKVIGKPIYRQDIPLKTNGEAIFGLDMKVEGMFHASVERSPVFLGKIISFNKEEVLKVPGVKYVIKAKRHVWGNEREGIAVVADTYWAALKGRKALKVEWDNKGLDEVNSEGIFEKYRTNVTKAGDVLYQVGKVDELLEESENILEAVYEVPYQSHVPLEPMNAIVHVEENRVTYWGATQNPNGVRDQLSRQLDIASENVEVNYTFMGGGFGRRSMTDMVEEAADIAKKIKAPVKVVWTREDDQTQGPFRACQVNALRGVLGDEGDVTALEHKVIAQQITNQTGKNMKAGRQLMGGVNTDYKIPNFAIKGVLQKSHIPITYWRAVYHSTNPFAHESFIDELAYKAGKDPLEFRLGMMQHHSKFTTVLNLVAEKARWYDKPTTGTAKGVALAERSGGYFAMICEVKQEGDKIKPVKITTAIDLGICINPDTVKAQTEGAVVMGLTAMYNGLTIKKGAVVEQNFDTYPLLRYDECPEIETFIVKSTDDPAGAGETGLPTVAPAFTNAVFALTGKRIRKLPISKNDLVAG